MNELLFDGIALMFIGMGTVFLFLCIMIVAMHGMGGVIKYLNKFFPEDVVQPAKASKPAADEEAVAVAVLKAVLGIS